MAADKNRRPTPRKRGKKAQAPRSAPSAAPRASKLPKAPKQQKPKQQKASKLRPSTVTRPRIPLVRRDDSPQAATQPRERRIRHQRAGTLRMVAIGAGALLALALVAVVALFVLRNSPVFAITSIEFEPTEHVSAEDVQNLAAVPEGSTLLNVDTGAIEESLRKNPWIASASFSRAFPNTLRITVEEQRPAALVLMSSGSIAWYLGESGCWIEPTKVEAAEGQSVDDAALAIAEGQGCLLVTDVPSTVDPVAGSEATDETLDAVRKFQEGFSEDFSSQVACYSAPSVENVSCVLKSGVEVALGAPTDISEKEEIVRGYLDQSDGHVVRINVRVPSNPAYREIDSPNVQPGEGVSTTGE